MPDAIPALDLLQQLDNRALAAYLDGRLTYLRHKPANFHVARALLWSPRALQDKVLNALNPIRRQRVEAYLKSFLSGGNPVSLEEMQQARKTLTAPLYELLEAGLLVSVPEPAPFIVADEGKLFSLNGTPISFPGLDLERDSPLELFAHWVAVARHYRASEDETLEGYYRATQHPLLRRILELALEAEPIPDFLRAVRREQAAFLKERAAYLEVARVGLIALNRFRESPERTAQKLAALVGQESITAESLLLAAENAPTASLRMPPAELAAALLRYKLRAKREGIISLDPELEKVEEGYLRLGLDVAIACWADNFIVPILTRRKQAILAELKTKIQMFTELCVGLHNGESPTMTEKRMSAFLAEEPDPL